MTDGERHVGRQRRRAEEHVAIQHVTVSKPGDHLEKPAFVHQAEAVGDTARKRQRTDDDAGRRRA
ncbi:MAG TPA: hypothetical protein VMM93_12350, partial [Vicinamibacterales bacterium]|nr:hypothetical protein [Vicinamibacterales bacterium]